MSIGINWDNSWVTFKLNSSVRVGYAFYGQVGLTNATCLVQISQPEGGWHGINHNLGTLVTGPHCALGCNLQAVATIGHNLSQITLTIPDGYVLSTRLKFVGGQRLD